MTRISRVIDKMREAGLKQILVSDPLSIKYLTGTMVHPGERMYALLIKGNGDLTLFANRLFNIEKLPCETVWYSDNENSIELIKERINALRDCGVNTMFLHNISCITHRLPSNLSNHVSPKYHGTLQ